MLLIARNNYFWGKEHKEIGFIANGDVARVERVRRVTEMYGFRFADVLLWFPYLEAEIEAKIILDTLTSESPALTREQGNDLFMRILEDYEDLSSKREKMKRLKEDPWFNALQVKFAYGMTCHKAQGGQWKTAFIDMGYIDLSAVGLDFIGGYIQLLPGLPDGYISLIRPNLFRKKSDIFHFYLNVFYSVCFYF